MKAELKKLRSFVLTLPSSTRCAKAIVVAQAATRSRRKQALREMDFESCRSCEGTEVEVHHGPSHENPSF
jgi:hypothetical protein